MKAKLLYSAILLFLTTITQVNAETKDAINKTINPIVTISGNTTICAGNTTILAINGTPNSTVTIETSPFSGTYALSIGAIGTAVFTTPILNETTTFSIVEIVEFATGIRTPITDVSITINVVANGCASISINSQYNDSFQCYPGECQTISALPTSVPSTTTYEVSSIPYCPQASFENPSWIQLYPAQISGDDQWSPTFNFPGASGTIPNFNFCFFGNIYNSLNVGTNGVITFDNQTVGAFCPWQYSSTIPNIGFPIKNAIFGVFQDTNYAVIPTPPFQLSTNYAVIGEYPCRKFVVNFSNLPQYQCDNSVGLQTSQVVLYEGSNIIEVFVKRRTPCSTWNAGNGLIGILNSSGTIGYAPTGRNTGNWNATNEAWRFTPNGPEIPYTFQWLKNGVAVSSNLSTIICPTETTTYTAQANYNLCGNILTVVEEITIPVASDETQIPVNLIVCHNAENIYTTDLTQNNVIILGFLNPNDFEITYYTTLVDATNGSNPLSNPTIYTFNNSQIIYTRIDNVTTGCYYIKQFVIQISEPVSPPIGITPQSFTPGQSLADLVVNGTNIIWYDAAVGGNVLPPTTLLQSDTTYYAAEVNEYGCESRNINTFRLAITAILTLNNDDFSFIGLNVYPNPTLNSFTISNNSVIDKIEIYNALGQKIIEKTVNSNQYKIDLLNYSSGVYFTKVYASGKSKIIKTIKK